MSNVLTKSQKRFVVMQLASGKGVVETARAFQREYAVLPSIQQMSRYDPTTITGAGLSDDLKELFFKVRERTVNALHLVPNAHAAIRAVRLEDMLTNVLIAGDHKLALAILAEARKNAEPFAWDADAGDDDEGDE
ncbi:uncharacterized protein DUF2280 [Paraburkholderia sp. BL27I4N3]|uniref:DUF2280 domain-containing protein n=1 Tax=Paraburkholderia sp. BL27I4N3 TaxID=1938805 RepID=UPI000E28785A|nr:DUF2280 domain-containing protein [Paraburkholderia sp. BL27I4N3]REE21210.1 uncharacterized protein DUF2280 [Paraburkholderia sp. BL27I4N3]